MQASAARKRLGVLVVLIAASAAVCSVLSGLYVYANLAVGEVDQAVNVAGLIRDGTIPCESLNERLERDGRSYRIRVGSDGSVTGAVGLVRDYFVPPNFDPAIAAAGVCALLSAAQVLVALVLLHLIRTGSAAAVGAGKARGA